MSVVDPLFLIVSLASILALHSRLLADRRAEVLGAASLVFAGGILGSAGDAACLATMALTGWALVKAVSGNKSGLLLAFGIACVLAEFVIVRRLLPDAPAPAWLAVGRTIGLSYVMFRVIHLIVDAHGDELPPRLGLGRTLCYLFLFLTFLAGPIQRVQEFVAELDRPLRTTLRDAAERAAPAIITGYLKFTVVAGGFYAVFAWSQDPGPGIPAPAAHATGWLSFAAYLYASFAGYTDIVRGIGGAIGLTLPANFNRPFAAANFLDLWARWHISLSEWFKFYVFNPAVKTMISVTGRPSLVPYLGAAGYFMTFFLMGLWHGIGWRYAMYGLLLGAGVSVNKLYQTALLRRLGRARTAALSRHPLYAAAAQSLAVAFFTIMLGFLWIPAGAIGRETITGWAGGAAIVVAAVAILVAAERATSDALASSRLAWPAGGAAGTAICAVQLAVVLAYVSGLHLAVPPLLYEYF